MQDSTIQHASRCTASSSRSPPPSSRTPRRFALAPSSEREEESTHLGGELLCKLLRLALEAEPSERDDKVSEGLLARLARLHALERLVDRDLGEDRVDELGGGKLEDVERGGRLEVLCRDGGDLGEGEGGEERHGAGRRVEEAVVVVVVRLLE